MLYPGNPHRVAGVDIVRRVGISEGCAGLIQVQELEIAVADDVQTMVFRVVLQQDVGISLDFRLAVLRGEYIGLEPVGPLGAYYCDERVLLCLAGQP